MTGLIPFFAEGGALRLAVAAEHDDASALALGGADSTEDTGPGPGPGSGPRGTRPGTTVRPAAGDLGPLATWAASCHHASWGVTLEGRVIFASCVPKLF